MRHRVGKWTAVIAFGSSGEVGPDHGGDGRDLLRFCVDSWRRMAVGEDDDEQRKTEKGGREFPSIFVCFCVQFLSDIFGTQGFLLSLSL